ncbi:MAG TPA: bifunctional alpha/beta hydrolase/OsmC family protein [Methylomirabilota bacterium]|nr:bifunctional alpha/beta hydrolase/OsmC family protein [Methylomirabilota bacterium]
MTTERVEFPGHSGATLAARLDLPDGPIRATALFAHCFTCSKDIPAARRIAGRLAALGFAVLRFDFTGLGHSSGEFASTNFTSNVGDLVAAAEYLTGRGLAPDLMIGHSLGGAAVLVAAREVRSARAVVTIGAPSDPSHVAHNFGGQLDEIRQSGAATVSLAGRDFEIRRQFLDDIAGASLKEAIAGLGKALLVLHAPRDDIVGIDNAAEIFKAARHPKSFVTLDGADHLITREADAEYVAEVVASWSSRYLDLPPEPKLRSAPDGVVRVAEASPDGFAQDVVIGGKHQLVVDEPTDVGGTDMGPTPYQLLSSALGACTTMTIRLYARKKGIALTHVSVDVLHDKRHADDSAELGTAKQKVDHFRRIVRLEGDLTEDQRASILAIADKCPVHRTLHGQAVIETDLVEMD